MKAHVRQRQHYYINVSAGSDDMKVAVALPPCSSGDVGSDEAVAASEANGFASENSGSAATDASDLGDVGRDNDRVSAAPKACLGIANACAGSRNDTPDAGHSRSNAAEASGSGSDSGNDSGSGSSGVGGRTGSV